MTGRSPDLATIGGRLKAERGRLALSQEAFAAFAGAGKSAQISWEKGLTRPNADALAAWAAVGVNVLYIVTGVEALHAPSPPAEAPPVMTVRQALAMLDPIDRHRLLLDLIATELRG